MNRSDKCWLVVGLLGLCVAGVVRLTCPSWEDAYKQPRSEGSGLFSRDELAVDPLNSAEMTRRNVQQAGI